MTLSPVVRAVPLSVVPEPVLPAAGVTSGSEVADASCSAVIGPDADDELIREMRRVRCFRHRVTMWRRRTNTVTTTTTTAVRTTAMIAMVVALIVLDDLETEADCTCSETLLLSCGSLGEVEVGMVVNLVVLSDLVVPRTLIVSFVTRSIPYEGGGTGRRLFVLIGRSGSKTVEACEMRNAVTGFASFS